MSEPLDDLSPMPFGVHRGKPMQDVPPQYLHWLWTNGKKEQAGKDVDPVADYIKANLRSLEKEYDDGIW